MHGREGRGREGRRSRAVVLCYHAVTDAWPDPLAVPAATLERQLETLLRHGFRSVPAAEALANDGRVFHVTFDDAYRNVLDIVPVLERLRVHATIFACSEYSADGRPLLIRELRARAAGFEPQLATMDWNTLREVSDRGFEVGSHTVSHPHLPDLSDADLRAELVQSRERIAEELGRPCRFIAYPFGENDSRVRNATAAAGYEAGFALRPARDGPASPLAVPRVDIYRGDTARRFALKTSRIGPKVSRLLDALRSTRR